MLYLRRIYSPRNSEYGSLIIYRAEQFPHVADVRVRYIPNVYERRIYALGAAEIGLLVAVSFVFFELGVVGWLV